MPRDRAVQLMVGRPLGDMYPALATRRRRARSCCGRAACRAPAPSPTSPSRCGPARSWALAGWSAAAAPRSRASCSASTGRPPARSGSTAAGRVRARRARRWRPASPIVSEDRIGQSLVMDFAILANASLPVIDQATRRPGWSAPARELGAGASRISSGCGCASAATTSRSRRSPAATSRRSCSPSGWRPSPRVLILDEPTQGVDVQTKAEVHAVIADLARQGLAIILISSELPELIGMCHRILVLREGRITAELQRGEATQERVLYAATDAGRSGRERPRRRRPSRAAASRRARSLPELAGFRRWLQRLAGPARARPGRRHASPSSCRWRRSTRAC